LLGEGHGSQAPTPHSLTHLVLLFVFACFVVVLLFLSSYFPPASGLLLGPGHHLRVVQCLFSINTKKERYDFHLNVVEELFEAEETAEREERRGQLARLGRAFEES